MMTMTINELNIPDITKNNIIKSKENLANDIINQIYPMMDEICSSKEEEYNTIQNEISFCHKKLNNKKIELDELMNTVKRQRKINKLLNRLEKIITSGMAIEASLKHETIILLKTIDKLSDERLDYNLTRTIKIISKRLSNS